MYRLLPLVLVLISCQEVPSLVGHWHAEIIYPTEDGVPHRSTFTFDLLNDTLISTWNNPPFWEGQPGYHDRATNTFRFGVECVATTWRYRIESANELSAADLHWDHPQTIKLTRHTDCTGESHLFMDSRLQVRLPAAVSGAIPLYSPALYRNITIGPAAADYQESYPGPFRYELGDKIITDLDTNAFALHESQHRVKIPESKRHLCSAVVYANAETTATALSAIFNYSFNTGTDTVYFAVLDRRVDTTVLRYLPIAVASHAAIEELTVEEWLNSPDRR